MPKLQPTLRAIPDAARVAECLAQALAGNGVVLPAPSQVQRPQTGPAHAAVA